MVADHVILGCILGFVATSNIVFAVFAMWLIRDTALKLAELIDQKTKTTPLPDPRL